VGIAALVAGLGGSALATVPAQAATAGCGVAHDSMNVVDKGLIGVRAGAVNLQVNWCWDGGKITSVSNPVVWTSITADGGFLVWHTDAPVPVDSVPQNGGYWARETVVTGTVQNCVIKYGCIPPVKPFKLDLYVFGDGVKYIANKSAIN
jgi:hypothetical protein